MSAFEKMKQAMKQAMKEAAWESSDEFLKEFVEEVGIRVNASPAKDVILEIEDLTNGKYCRTLSLKELLLESSDISDKIPIFEGIEKTGAILLAEAFEDLASICRQAASDSNTGFDSPP